MATMLDMQIVNTAEELTDRQAVKWERTSQPSVFLSTPTTMPIKGTMMESVSMLLRPCEVTGAAAITLQFWDKVGNDIETVTESENQQDNHPYKRLQKLYEKVERLTSQPAQV